MEKSVNKPPAKSSGGVLRGVTQTIRRFGRPGASQSAETLPHYLVVMNAPPLMARRDAAYAQAIDLLRSSLFSLPEDERIPIYDQVIFLIDDALSCGRRLPKPESNKHDPAPFNLYLEILRDTVCAILMLLTNEQHLFEEERGLNLFIGSEFSAQLRETEEVFSNSEVGLYHCVQDFIDVAEPAISRFCEQCRNALSKNDVERYDKALLEFKKVYRQKL